MRAAAYTRVSTEGQAEDDKTSLGEQVLGIEQHCERKGHAIVQRYQDVGSGSSITKRPEFQRMLADARSGLFDVIVCWKSDRLSRGLFPAAALNEPLEAAQARLEALQSRGEGTDRGAQATSVLAFFDGLAQTLDTVATGEDRKALLRLLVGEIVIDGETIRFTSPTPW